MALTYTESDSLMNDFIFRGRIRVSCLSFAKYIAGEPVDTPAHVTRMRWAQSVYQSPDPIAAGIHPEVVMQDQVQADGAAISDANLQTAVETVVKQQF